jgi:outer membrane protein OmpA-like peptidoglycan-associated protein
VLNLIVQRAKAAPQVIVELIGLTDATGSSQYNLALSRRRAETVQRYLVRSHIPSPCIYIVSLGEEPVPATLAASLRKADPSASPRDSQRSARRVHILVYSTGKAQNEAVRATPSQ